MPLLCHKVLKCQGSLQFLFENDILDKTTEGAQKMSKLPLNFQVDKTFDAGIERLKNILDFEAGNGITVTAVEGDRAGVTLKDGVATLYYHKKHYFFRALGLLVEHAKTQTDFEISFLDSLHSRLIRSPYFKRSKISSLVNIHCLLPHYHFTLKQSFYIIQLQTLVFILQKN